MKKPQHNTYPSTARSAYINKLVASRLLASPIFGALERIPVEPSTRFLALALGNANMISGRIKEIDGKQIGCVDDFRVATGLQGYGIGTRLFKAFVAESQDIGVAELHSYSVSAQALGVRARIFGEECLQFYDDDRPEITILPMTFNQALATNKRIDELDALYPDREDASGYVGVFMDVAAVDTTGWERPHSAHLYVNAA